MTDYEEKYNRALELAASYYDEGTNEFLDTLFPELLAVRLERLIRNNGEPWNEQHEADFGLEGAEAVVDFYNGDGLCFKDDRGENLSIQYAAIVNGEVEVGLWRWGEDEDFDEDAEFMVCGVDDFTDWELNKIANNI